MEVVPEGRSRARFLGGAFVLMMGGRIVGAALSPALLAFAPLALLALSPVPACLVTVAALSTPLPYYAVAVPISVSHNLLGYFLGRAQGPFILDFLVKRGVSSKERLTRLLSPLRVSAPLLVFVIPGPVVCALAGASAASARSVVPAIVLSQIMWAFLCRLFGEGLLAWLSTMRLELARYALPLTLVTSAIALGIYFRRKARASERAEPR